MPGVFSPASSSPVASVTQLPESEILGCQSCGRPTSDLFWKTGRRPGHRGPVIERVCHSCADEPIEVTTGAIGLPASDDVNQAAITPLGIGPRAPLALINSSTAPGARRSIDLLRDAGRAPISPLEPFKTLLQGVYSNATDWVRGVLQSIAGGER